MPKTHLRRIAFDPDEAWLPWRPTANDPWGSKWAAHLYRRATFGPSPEEIEEAKRIGVQGTLDLLLQGKPDQEDWRKTLDDVGRVAAEMDEDGGDLRGSQRGIHKPVDADGDHPHDGDRQHHLKKRETAFGMATPLLLPEWLMALRQHKN